MISRPMDWDITCVQNRSMNFEEFHLCKGSWSISRITECGIDMKFVSNTCGLVSFIDKGYVVTSFVS